MKNVSCIDQLSFVKHVTNVPTVASNLPVGARLQNFWKAWEDLGAGPKVAQILKEGYTLPFQIRPNLGKITHHYKLLCQSPQEPLPVGGITSAYKQKCSRIGRKSDISRVFQPTVFGPKTRQQMETYTRSEHTEPIPQGRKIKNEDTGNHQNVSPNRGSVSPQ